MSTDTKVDKSKERTSTNNTPVDTRKVEIMKEKIANKELGILGDEKEREAQALEIAEKIQNPLIGE